MAGVCVARRERVLTKDRLASKAFETVFQRKQTRHGALLKWLRARLAAVRISSTTEREVLEAAIGRQREE